MNCTFCARAGAANAATPTSDASAIPTRFPIIGSSINNNGSRSGPKPTRGSVKFSATLVAAGAQFKLQISKPEKTVGWQSVLQYMQCARDLLASGTMKLHGQKSINGGLFCPASQCTRCVCGPSSV